MSSCEEPPAVRGDKSARRAERDSSGQAVAKPQDDYLPSGDSRPRAKGQDAAKGQHAAERQHPAFQGRGPVGRHDGPRSRVGRVVPVTEGQSLEDVLIKHGGYHKPIPPDVLAQVARMNGIANPDELDGGKITIFSPEEIYHEIRPYDRRELLDKARYVTVGPHESWDDVANRLLNGIPNDQARRGVIRALKLVNGLKDNAPPPPILVAPDWEAMAGALETLRQQGGRRQVGMLPLDRRVRQLLEARFGAKLDDVKQTHTAGAMYAPKPGEDLRYATLATYHEHLLAQGLTEDEAAGRLEEYMLVIALVNGLETTDVDSYESIYLPEPHRLDRIVSFLRDRKAFAGERRDTRGVARDIVGTGLGALRDARAHAEGRAPKPTGRSAGEEELQSAKLQMFQQGLDQELKSGWTSLFPMPFLGFPIAAANTYLKMSGATARVSNERSSDELFTAWLERTGAMLSPGEQDWRTRAGERVAKDVAQLQKLGLVDSKGYLTFAITDPSRIDFEVRKATQGSGIDPMVRARLIEGLETKLAHMAKGEEPIAKVDAYSAMLVAGMRAPRDRSKPMSVVFSATDWRVLDDALFEPGYDYEPVPEDPDDFANPANVTVERITTMLVDEVVKLNNSLGRFRARLQRALAREAQAIAYLERETKQYAKRIKQAALFIERELREGRVPGGPATESQARSFDT